MSIARIPPSLQIRTDRREPTLEDVITERDRNLRDFFNKSPGAAEAVYTLLNALAQHARRKGLRADEVGIDDARATGEGYFHAQFVQHER